MAARQIKKCPNRKNSTSFKPGTSGNPAGNPSSTTGGAPPKRERYRDRLRYRMETPLEEQPKVAMTPADSFAMKTLKSLQVTEAGPQFVSTAKVVEEMCYGKDTDPARDPMPDAVIVIHEDAP